MEWHEALQVANFAASLVVLIVGIGIAIGYTRFQDWRQSTDRRLGELETIQITADWKGHMAATVQTLVEGQSKVANRAQEAVNRASINAVTIDRLERQLAAYVPNETCAERHRSLRERLNWLERKVNGGHNRDLDG